MIYHLIQDDMSSQAMADLAKGRLRNKIEDLGKSLEGNLTNHHRLILKLTLQMIGSYDEAIEQLNVEIAKRMESYQYQSEAIQTIPGVKKKSLSESSPKSE
jgi:transposase